MEWSSVRCLACREQFLLERDDASILGPHDDLPTVGCPECGRDAVPGVYLPDLVVSREKHVIIEISGKKSSIHDPSKADFYCKHGIRWIEVTNETVRSHQAVRAICQALAVAAGSSHPQRVWNKVA